MESTRKKLEASEEKRFWRQVLLKWWHHQKHLIRSTPHQKHISPEAHWWFDQVSNNSFWCADNQQRLFHTSI